LISRPDIDQNLDLLPLNLLQQLARILLLALVNAASEVALEGFLTPRALGRVCDGGEGGGGEVEGGGEVLEVEGEGSLVIEAV
jgi:hypothetical protein